jgi:purine-cytosine permease-like protein
MDSWLIACFETLMSRSRVSPYALSRFLFTGVPIPLFLGMRGELSRPEVWAVLLLLGLAYLLPLEYRATYTAERENRCGLLNSKKFGNPAFRLLCVFSILAQVGLFALDVWFGGRSGLDNGLFHLAWAAYWLLLGAALYFQASNWVPPARVSQRKDKFAAGVIG